MYILSYMQIQLNKYWRILHTITAVFYLLLASILYNSEHDIGFIIYILYSIISFIWSLISYEGNVSLVVKIDVYMSYICILYNLYYFLNLSSTDRLNKIDSCIVCYIASLIYLFKELVIRYTINLLFSYRVLHFFWRSLCAYGTFLLYIE